jgi:small GTP-binding protein
MDRVFDDESGPSFKVVLAGTAGAGKTSLIFWLIHGRFIEGFHSTVGPAVSDWTGTINEHQYEVKIWDTAGQERYRALTPVYFREASAGIIVFDSTEPNPSDSVCEWVELFRGSALASAAVIVAANKIDLLSDLSPLFSLGQTLKQDLGVDFCMVSAKDGRGITELFDLVLTRLVNKPSDTQTIHLERIPPKENCSCLM